VLAAGDRKRPLSIFSSRAQEQTSAGRDSALCMLQDSHLQFSDCTSLWDILCLAIDRQKRYPAFTILVSETVWQCWVERNNFIFREQSYRKPVFKLVRNACLTIEALLYQTSNAKKASKLLADKQILFSLVSDYVTGTSFVPRQTTLSLPSSLLGNGIKSTGRLHHGS
jgi:hypothetical protein